MWKYLWFARDATKISKLHKGKGSSRVYLSFPLSVCGSVTASE